MRYHPQVPQPDDIKLPRDRGLRLSGAVLFRIALTAALLFAIIVLRKPCADATGRFVNAFESVDANGGTGQAPGTPHSDIIPLRPNSDVIPLSGMTDDEVKRVYEDLQRKAGVLPDASMRLDADERGNERGSGGN